MELLNDSAYEKVLSDKSQDDWAEFVSQDHYVAIKPTQYWRRFDHNGHRFYYLPLNDGSIRIAAGITSVLAKVMAEGEALKAWRERTPDWRKVLDESATYGTIMHTLSTEWLTKREIDENWFRVADKKFGRGKGDQLRRDMLAKIQWVEDYDVKPLLIEGMCACNAYENGDQLVSAVDLLCMLTLKEKTKVEVPTGEYYTKGEKKGQPKYETKTLEEGYVVHGIVDDKSNFADKDSKDYYEYHRMQLYFQRRAVYDTLNLEVNHLFNWSPNAWRGEKPTYTFKRHDIDKTEMSILSLYLLIAYKRGYFRPDGAITVYPEFNYGTRPTDFKRYSYEEYVKEFLIQKQF